MSARSSSTTSVEAVFTPSSLPHATFVERPEIGARLAFHLRTRGRPISIVGPYRSGKTTLVLKMIQREFDRHIHVVCKTTSTFEQLMLEAFDDLTSYYSQGSKKAPMTAEFMGIKAVIARTPGNGDRQPKLPPQLTSRALASFAAAANAPWVIDDTHKLPRTEINKVAEAMREWQTLVLDAGTPKMVVIGSEQLTTSLPELLVAAAPDLQQRLASLTLPLMTHDELADVIEHGAKALNLDFAAVADQIIHYSYGFPGVCQDLCAHVCNAAGVRAIAARTVSFTADHLQNALQEHVDVCALEIKRALTAVGKARVNALPPAFVKTALDAIAARDLAGVELTTLTSGVASNLGVPENAVSEGLMYLTDDETGVLRIEDDRIHFREPMYLVQYTMTSAAARKEVRKVAFLNKFLEIMGGGAA